MDRDDDRKITSEEADRIAREKWNKKYSGEFNEKRATYDGWLDDFFHYILECETPILDLGCGNGNNARYLAKKGKEVIACDYSESALETIKENMPEISDRMCFDMRDGLPFDDNFTSIIIADLSLHYFTEEDTVRILNEIHRVLKPNGMLLFRVNSTNDINYGALEGEEIEYITTPELIEEKFGRDADIIIDGGIGETEPSTIVNCVDGEMEVVRQGKGWLEE